MIHKLSKVGKDNEAWKKAEEYLTQLQDDEHIPFSKIQTSLSTGHSTCTAATKQAQQSRTRWRSKADVGDVEDRDLGLLPWKNKFKPFKRSCAQTQREPSAAATVYQCRRRLCLCASKKKAAAANEDIQYVAAK